MSLGLENSPQDVDELVQALDDIARRSRAKRGDPFVSTRADVQKQMDELARAAARRVYAERERGEDE